MYKILIKITAVLQLRNPWFTSFVKFFRIREVYVTVQVFRSNLLNPITSFPHRHSSFWQLVSAKNPPFRLYNETNCRLNFPTTKRKHAAWIPSLRRIISVYYKNMITTSKRIKRTVTPKSWRSMNLSFKYSNLIKILRKLVQLADGYFFNIRII